MSNLIEPFTLEGAAATCGSNQNALDSGIEVIRSTGTQRPLFLVHNISGQAAYGAALSQYIDADLPMYGMSGAAPHEQLPRTIEGLASRCIRLMRTVQPRGPYRVVGWAFGGIVAYEIAAQLIGQDETVEFLGMIDSVCPALPRSAPMPVMPSIEQQLLHHYAMQQLPIPMHLFCSTSEAPSSTQMHDRAHGWDAIVPCDRLHLHRLPVAQDSMLSTPHAAVLGRALDAAIRLAASANSRRVDHFASANHSHVCIQAGRRGRHPIFCVPGAGNSVTDFNAWADAVGKEWPIHGLQPRGLADGLVPHSTVQAAAAQYLSAIDKVCPHGPLHLLGHSFGGWIVLELAIRMRARGRTVASLTIIDAESPDSQDRLCRDYTAVEVFVELVDTLEMAVEQSLGIKASDLMMLDDPGRLQLLHRALVRVGVMPVRSRPEVLAGMVRTFGAALRTTYQPPEPYPGPLRLVTVSDTRLSTSADEQRRAEQLQGWRQWVPRLHAWHGPGNHMTLLDPPHVAAVADWWRNGLRFQH